MQLVNLSITALSCTVRDLKEYNSVIKVLFLKITINWVIDDKGICM